MTEQRQMTWERIGISLLCLTYLVLFNRVLPHGDALRIVRQIETSDLIWNPNHLLFDPLGYGFYRLLQGLGLPIDILTSFEALSGISTIVSLLLFHALLYRAGVVERPVRLLATAALFSCASFISVATSQYYFMVQMPFLLGALYLYIDFVQKEASSARATRNLYGIGILLAIATGIMFNNLLVLIAMGLSIATLRGWPLRWQSSIRVFAAAAAVGFPIFIGGYLLSNTTSDLFTWVLSYEGNAASGLNEHYGAKWTAESLVQGVAMVGFNFSLGNMVENAGLGTVLSVLMFGGDLEFTPQWGRILLSLIVSLPVIGLHAALAWYALRHLGRDATVRLLTAWTAAYLLFNFLWNVGDEIFWVQILPAIWMLVLISQHAARNLYPSGASRSLLVPGGWRFNALATLVVLLLVVNTVNAVIPVSSSAFLDNRARHTAMLRDGDLEIVPGWDQQKWMTIEDGGPDAQKLLLMNMAVPGASPGIAELPSIIDSLLRQHGRVIVGRVFDKDDDLMPWYSLADIGWPREKIQGLLRPYCSRRLETIDGVVFRELYVCETNSSKE